MENKCAFNFESSIPRLLRLSLLFPNKHLKVEDQLLQLPILADDWLQNLLNVDIVCPVLLQHDHV